MGTWGVGPFDSDEALDWLEEGDPEDETGLIIETLESVLSVDDEVILPEPTGTHAIAAAECVAASLGRPYRGDTEDVMAAALLEGMRGIRFEPKVIEMARLAVQRVRTKSELQHEWDGNEPNEWQQMLQDLEARLG